MSAFRSVRAGIGDPITIRIVPGRLRNARRPQNRPESVETGITGRPVRDARAAMPDCKARTVPARSACPRGRSRSAAAPRTARSASRSKTRIAAPPASRSTAIMPDTPDQRTEQRNPQQFILEHVAAARQQGQPDESIERRLVARGDQRRARGDVLKPADLQPDAADDPHRHNQVRAHSMATSSTRRGPRCAPRSPAGSSRS